MNNFSTLVTNKTSRQGVIPWKALIFSAVIFGLSLMIYVGLAFGYKSFISSAIAEAEERIAELERDAPKEETKKEFIQFYSQLTNIRSLLESHTAVTPFFAALEANTMADVGFSAMTINIKDRTVNMSGFARSYKILAGQVAVYEDMPGVERTSLTSVRRADDVVSFELRIVLEPDLFKPSPIVAAPLIEQGLVDAEQPILP